MKHYLSIVLCIMLNSSLYAMKKSIKLARKIKQTNNVTNFVGNFAQEYQTQKRVVNQYDYHSDKSFQSNTAKSSSFSNTLPTTNTLFGLAKQFFPKQRATTPNTKLSSLQSNNDIYSEISEAKEEDSTLSSYNPADNEQLESKEDENTLSSSTFCTASVITSMEQKNKKLENLMLLKSIFLEPINHSTLNIPLYALTIPQQLLSGQSSIVTYNSLKNKEQELKISVAIVINHIMSAARLSETQIKQLQATSPKDIKVIITLKDDARTHSKHTFEVSSALLAECLEELNQQASSITSGMIPSFIPDPLLAQRCIISLTGLKQTRFRMGNIHVTIKPTNKLVTQTAADISVLYDESSLQDQEGNILQPIELPSQQQVIRKSVKVAAQIIRAITSNFSFKKSIPKKGMVYIQSYLYRHNKESIVLVDCLEADLFNGQLHNTLQNLAINDVPLAIQKSSISAVQQPLLNEQNIQQFMQGLENNNYIMMFNDYTLAGLNSSIKDDRMSLVIPQSVEQPINLSLASITKEIPALTVPNQDMTLNTADQRRQDHQLSYRLDASLQAILEHRFINTHQDQRTKDIELLKQKAQNQQQLRLQVMSKKTHQQFSFFIPFKKILKRFKALNNQSIIPTNSSISLINDKRIEDFLFGEVAKKPLRFEQNSFELVLSEINNKQITQSSDSYNVMNALPAQADSNALLTYKPYQEASLMKQLHNAIIKSEANTTPSELSLSLIPSDTEIINNPNKQVSYHIQQLIQSILSHSNKKNSVGLQAHYIAICQQKQELNKKIYVRLKDLATQKKSIFVLSFLSIINYLNNLQNSKDLSVVPYTKAFSADYKQIEQSVLDVLFKPEDKILTFSTPDIEISIQQKTDEPDEPTSPIIQEEQSDSSISDKSPQPVNDTTNEQPQESSTPLQSDTNSSDSKQSFENNKGLPENPKAIKQDSTYKQQPVDRTPPQKQPSFNNNKYLYNQKPLNSHTIINNSLSRGYVPSYESRPSKQINNQLPSFASDRFDQNYYPPAERLQQPAYDVSTPAKNSIIESSGSSYHKPANNFSKSDKMQDSVEDSNTQPYELIKKKTFQTSPSTDEISRPKSKALAKKVALSLGSILSLLLTIVGLFRRNNDQSFMDSIKSFFE